MYYREEVEDIKTTQQIETGILQHINLVLKWKNQFRF